MSDLLIEGLNLTLQPIAWHHRTIAAHLGIDIVFTSGYRTFAQQMEDFRKGRAASPGGWQVVDAAAIVTFALPDQDPHCRRAAYDLVPIVNERAAWDRLDLFAQLGRIGKELGLVWGGDWRKIRDLSHFELANWRTLPLDSPELAVA